MFSVPFSVVCVFCGLPLVLVRTSLPNDYPSRKNPQDRSDHAERHGERAEFHNAPLASDRREERCLTDECSLCRSAWSACSVACRWFWYERASLTTIPAGRIPKTVQTTLNDTENVQSFTTLLSPVTGGRSVV